MHLIVAMAMGLINVASKYRLTMWFFTMYIILAKLKVVLTTLAYSSCS